MSAKQVQERFYQLACEYNISVSNSNMVISLRGLGDNMQEAMTLMESVINHAKVDRDAYRKFVEQELKSRRDNKLSKLPCSAAVWRIRCLQLIPQHTRQRRTREHQSADSRRHDWQSEELQAQHHLLRSAEREAARSHYRQEPCCG